MDNCFFESGLHFSCKKCSNCCRGGPGNVFLSQNDLTKLAEWFNLSESNFVKGFCRKATWRDGSSVVSLLEKENFDCIFWDRGCTVYEVRPIQCVTYPFWKWVIADENTWRSEKKECPGIDEGKLWSKEDILEQMHRHFFNRPLKWTEGSAD